MSKSLWESQQLVRSMLGPISNKIKLCIEFPRKNTELAKNEDFVGLINIVLEQLLPQWCRQQMKDTQAINNMHNLVYLFAQKTHQVFQARVIHQIIDQNWDLKGFKAVLMRIFKIMQLDTNPEIKNFDAFLEKFINGQNLQSASCIRAVGSFLRKKKPITEDDLSNPIGTYSTTYEFLKSDIERYRDQNIGYECFQVLHPWAYDLDTVDMKYIVNTNLEGQICGILKDSTDAQLFWLSFFKSQLACSADEFMESIRQLAEMCGIPGFYYTIYEDLKQLMVESQYVITIENHAK